MLPKHPQVKNKQQVRRLRALERRKADLDHWKGQAAAPNNAEGKAFTAAKLKAAERDVAGLEANIKKAG